MKTWRDNNNNKQLGVDCKLIIKLSGRPDNNGEIFTWTGMAHKGFHVDPAWARKYFINWKSFRCSPKPCLFFSAERGRVSGISVQCQFSSAATALHSALFVIAGV